MGDAMSEYKEKELHALHTLDYAFFFSGPRNVYGK